MCRNIGNKGAWLYVWGGGCVCVCVCVDFMVYVHAFFKEHVGIWVFCVRGSVCVCVHRLMYMVL